MQKMVDSKQVYIDHIMSCYLRVSLGAVARKVTFLVTVVASLIFSSILLNNVLVNRQVN